MTRRSGILIASDLGALLQALKARGFELWGPRERDGAVLLDRLRGVEDLPLGRIDVAEAGSVRMTDGPRAAYFDHTIPMQGLKRLAFPPEEKLFESDVDLSVREAPVDAAPKAVIGVRGCDLAALETLSAVFEGGPHRDDRFATRRKSLFLVAVNCARAAATCFCASMGTGPRATAGYDLCLTELMDGEHRFLIEAGSDRGAEILSGLPCGETAAEDDAAAEETIQRTADSMARAMPAGMPETLKQSYEDPHWEAVAERCLACANCTLVCPTCFCNTVEDRSSLDGATAERWRRWDSCFSLEFSYIHGGSVRKQTASRYRQWMTHKLSSWHDQFGRSGCVGCGRCIAWCPVGIDIVAEARALAKPKEA